MPATTAITGGETIYALGGDNGIGGRRLGMIRERVQGAQTSQYLTLQQPLPPGSRIVHATITNNLVCPMYTGAATNVAQLGVALVATATSSIIATAVTHNIAIYTPQTAYNASIPTGSVTGLASVATTAGGVARTTIFDIISTTPAPLSLVP